MTPAEWRLWYFLKASRLNGLHFRRQQPIAGFIADFYCHQLKLIIEVDGSIHDQTKDYDSERDKALSSIGMTILHFQNDQVLSNINEVLAIIRHKARSQKDASVA